MQSKVEINVNELGVNLSILKIKDLIIQENKNAIEDRNNILDSKKDISSEMREKFKINIKQLQDTIKILEKSNMKYKFNGLFVFGRSGLIEAKFQPQFINEWKLHMDTAKIPPTIYRAIDDLKIKRPYNHIKFNDISDEKSNSGAALVEFSSVRYNALQQKQIKSFIIACSFSEESDDIINDFESKFSEMDV